MSKTLEGIVGKVRDKLEATYPLRVTNEHLKVLSNHLNRDSLEKLEVKCAEEVLVVKGIVKFKKFGIPIKQKFSAELSILRFEKRKVIMKLERVLPINSKGLNKIFINKIPGFVMDKEEISFDLNTIKVIEAVPFGNITSIQFHEGYMLIDFKLITN